MINMDAPQHTKLRLHRQPRLHAAPGRARSRTTCACRPREIVDAVAPKGECDFVDRDRRRAAAADHLRHDGHPAERRARASSSSRTSSSASATPSTCQTMEDAHGARAWSCSSTALDARPRTASTTRATTSRATLMHAEVDGERLTAAASSARSSSCSSSPATRRPATRSATACWRCTNNPDQQRDLDGRLRRRRADRGRGDRALGDAGDPLPPHRDAGHRDRRPADQGGREGRDVLQLGQPRRARTSTTRTASTSRRTPNEHVGFGAGGPHFCLGANLARREITVMFEELFRRLPDIEITGEPDMLQSAFIHGIKRMPCEFTPK